MNINGIGASKITNLYNGNKKTIENNTVKSKKDSIEISTLGKSLISFTAEESFESSSEKIEKLRKEVSQGTYKPDSRLTARKMIDIFRRRGV